MALLKNMEGGTILSRAYCTAFSWLLAPRTVDGGGKSMRINGFHLVCTAILSSAIKKKKKKGIN